MKDLKLLGLNWSDIEINKMYNAIVYRGDSLYYSNNGSPVFEGNLIVLEKFNDYMTVCYLPENKKMVGTTSEIFRTQFENKILFTYA